MNVQEIYRSKLATADQAAAVVKSGDWVDYGWAILWRSTPPWPAG